MIAAQELRFGNIVYDCDGDIVVVTELRDEFFLTKDGGRSYSKSNPIPLSSEILCKCDLKSIPIEWIDDEYSVDLEFSHVNGQDTNGRDELWVYYNNARICVLTHLHQLQNLYFSLTGTELEVKL